jgi:hypothetical protein
MCCGDKKTGSTRIAPKPFNSCCFVLSMINATSNMLRKINNPFVAVLAIFLFRQGYALVVTWPPHLLSCRNWSLAVSMKNCNCTLIEFREDLSLHLVTSSVSFVSFRVRFGMLNTRNLRDTMCPLHYGFVLHMVPHKSSVKKRDHIRVRYAAVYTDLLSFENAP